MKHKVSTPLFSHTYPISQNVKKATPDTTPSSTTPLTTINRKQLALHILTTHLLSTPPARHSSSTIPPTPTAFYIDPLGTFSPRALQTLLTSRLRARYAQRLHHNGGYVYGRDARVSEHVVNEEVVEEEDMEIRIEKRTAEAMDEVSVMRVFDFAGLMEAVAEVEGVIRGRFALVGIGGEGSAGAGGGDDEGIRSGRDGREQGVELGGLGAGEEESVAPEERLRKRRKVVIGDSQADPSEGSGEEGVEEDEVQEQLPQSDTSQIQQDVNTHDLPLREQHTTSNAQKESLSDIPPSHHTLLIIPSLPTLLTPLMRKNHITGHALLCHLGRSLAHLTSSSSSSTSTSTSGNGSGVCILIFNTTVSPYTTTTTTTAYNLESNPAQQQRPQTISTTVNNTTNAEANPAQPPPATPTPSIFAANALRPALGRTWPFYLDTSVLVTRVRASRGGGGGGGVTVGQQMRDEEEWRGAGNKFVFEVLADRFAGRVGRWCCFEVLGEGVGEGGVGERVGEGGGRLRGLK